MFWHNFKYSLKTLFRNKALIFWTFAFPIIMAVLFNLALGNIEKNEQLKIFDIAVIENEELNQQGFIKEALNTLSDTNNENQLFNVKYVNEEEAKRLLDSNQIVGYLIIDKNLAKVTIKQNGINETIFQNVAKEINENKKIVENLINKKIKDQMANGNNNVDINSIYAEAINSLENTTINMVEDNSPSKLSYLMIEYYTLIAMACLYGSLLAMTIINSILPNISIKGMRINMSCASKIKVILSGALASLVVQIIGIAILFAFTILVLHVDYGDKFGFICLLAFTGCLAGLSLGIFVASVLKLNENAKTGILIALTMLGCYFSGMMGITMKYIVDTNCPIINKINPAAMITDGYYSLYYYNTLNRFYTDIISLIVFSIILVAISTVVLRRQKYDSI